MKKLLIVLLSAVMLVSLTACGSQKGNATADGSKKQPVFTIGAIPDQNVSDLERRFGDMAKYISDNTGLKVKYVPSQNYAALVAAFKRGDVQLAWFGGLTGVQARSGVPGSEAIAMRPTDSSFHSVFIVHSGLNVKKLQDLKGLTFTFGSESSTSGHLMPRYYLMQAGINPDKDFNGKPNYSGTHDKTLKLVESGAYQAGALNQVVWKERVKEGKVDQNKVHAFYTTPAFFDYNWSINGDVDQVFGQGTKDKVKKALLSMSSDNKNISNILKYFSTDKFVPTQNSNYTAIEKVAKQLGIIK